MKCDFEKLSAYFDGLLSGAERAELEKHLKTCETCSARLEELVRLEIAVKKIPAPKLSEAYWENFADRVQNKIAIRGKQRATPNWLENLKSFFQPTTGKLALAGSLATILLVAILGQDYWKKEAYQPPVFDGQEVKGIAGLNDSLQKQDLKHEKGRQIEADKRRYANSVRRDEPALEQQTRENKQKGLLAPPASAIASKPAEKGVFRSTLKDEKANQADLVEERVQNEPAGETAPVPANKPTQGDTVLVIAPSRAKIRKEVSTTQVKVGAEEIEKLPAKNVQNLLKVQTGVTAGEDQVYIRGKRQPAQEDTVRISGRSERKIADDRYELNFPGLISIPITNEKGDTIGWETYGYPLSVEAESILQAQKTAMLRAEAERTISDIRQTIDENEKKLKRNLSKSETESLYVYLAQLYVQLCRLSLDQNDWEKANKRLTDFLKTDLSKSNRQWLVAIQDELKKLKNSRE